MPDDDLDWDDLRYFLRATQAGTLAGAARAMGVEHTTIGRRISNLERALGAPLVLRGPEGLKLTLLGEQAAPLVEEVERAVLTLQGLVAARQARVRLAVPSGFTGLLMPRIAELRREHPRLSVELMSGSRAVDLKKGEADLAIRVGPIADKDLVARKLCETGWALYASDAYVARRSAPTDPDDLVGHEVIGYDPSLAAMPASKWLEARSTDATVVMRSREVNEMLAAALSGVGLAALPCLTGDSEAQLVRLSPDVIATRNVSLVYRREAKLSAEVRAVIRFVIEVMRELGDRFLGAPRQRIAAAPAPAPRQRAAARRRAK